eukprot:TRINITY_DN9289_c0_g1_i1.p1 TRINITY_DN9289_c0_g1~~TRINITY_DN9289_c0_g1_i1.p1  ORF type:complete len:145 (+),score=18.16 TRINITY_DN9289_c0_g1_i1:33-467(+)
MVRTISAQRKKRSNPDSQIVYNETATGPWMMRASSTRSSSNKKPTENSDDFQDPDSPPFQVETQKTRRPKRKVNTSNKPTAPNDFEPFSFGKLELPTLKKYKSHFKLRTDTRAKSELVIVVSKHFAEFNDFSEEDVLGHFISQS